MSCLMLAKLINNLPPRLQDLHIDASVTPASNHDMCEAESRLFKSHDSVLSLRCVGLRDGGWCFTHRSFIHLLKRCPDLEDLRLPYAYKGVPYDPTKMGQLLDSDLTHLSSLSMNYCCPECQPRNDVSVILRMFSRGFKRLWLKTYGCRYHNSPPTWTDTLILETLIATSTVNTIEGLTFLARIGHADRITKILKHCPRLRVFRVENFDRDGYDEGIEAKELLSSMKGPWKCQETLEELQVMIREDTHDAEKDIQQLCLRLKSFARSATFFWSRNM
ncbi:MAG: hypothetical protein J3Q66DRAFT_326097 [Benniella sp.]|nr:MAG: hypothetical protein J3Q66DRAFT_326097 [Benniella sp.]